MLAQKKMLSLEELEAQTMVALPDRELMHVHKGGSHAASTSTTTTTVTACSQSNAHSNNALLSIVPIFAPLNLPILSCNTAAF
jgi:hypothetical protein